MRVCAGHVAPVIRRQFSHSYFPCGSSVTIPCLAIGDVGGFEEDFVVYEDWVFFSRLWFYKTAAFVITDILSKSHIHTVPTLHGAQSENPNLLGRYFYERATHFRRLKHYLVRHYADRTRADSVRE